MSEAETITPPATAHLQDLVDVIEAPGPFATVVTEIEPSVENAVHRRELRWKGMRETLVGDGCPEPVADAVGAQFLANPDHRGGLAIVATADGVLHTSRHVAAPDADVVRWAPLPSVVPVIAWRQASPPHLVVLVDREGADIHISASGTATTSVAGPDNVINKPSAGGWSHRRVQSRAEDSWQHNARAVADVVARVSQTTHARLVLVGGDEQAVRLFRGALPADTAELVHPLEGGSRQSGFDGVTAEVFRQVATVAADDTTRFLQAFRQEIRRHDRAIEGADPTFEALARGQVEVLGVHDPGDDTVAWFGPGPTQLATRADTLRDLGVDDPVAARRVDVAVRGALLTGAGVQVIPWHAGPRDGLGGLLRWSD